MLYKIAQTTPTIPFLYLFSNGKEDAYDINYILVCAR